MRKFLLSIAVLSLLPTIASSQFVTPTPDCYDAVVRGEAISQIPSEFNDCGDDCIVMRWPWFIEIKVDEVIEGRVTGFLAGRRIRGLTVQHTYFERGSGIWMLRRNTNGGYNVTLGADEEAAVRCPRGTSPQGAFLGAPPQRLEELRLAGERRYGSHSN
jgi:hypothetical protein